MRQRVVATVVVLLAASLGWADWWDIHRADQDFDLDGARQAALATVAENPTGVDAVGAALWWLNSLNHLPDPSEILLFDQGPRDPELGFLMAHIAAEILGRPPEGSLMTVELAGPFGVFDDLDLERNVVPDDDALPALETPWTQVWSPYRLLMTTPDGTVAPPESLDVGGVSLAAWTFQIQQPLDGWMVVEGRGGLNVELDGVPIARLRLCGQEDPEVNWFRVGLGAGKHRLRIAMGSRMTPRARVSLFDSDGSPVEATVLPGVGGPWAASTAERQLPPAAAALADRIDGGEPAVADVLLAAELASGRGDPHSQLAWLEQAVDLAPEDPWPRLALAWFYLMGATGSDPETDYQRARDELRYAGDVPGSKLAERALALREQRPEDLERVLDEVVESNGDDARVRQLWVREALRRGWVGEVEEGINELELELPESQSVMDLRLSALEALDQWEDRRDLLRSVAGTDPVRLQWIEALATGCLAHEAVSALDRIDDWVDDPSMDIAKIRLLIGEGDLERAREEWDRAQLRWGVLPALDQLRLVLEATDEEALDEALAAALESDPSNIQYRTLAWSRGLTPFFEDFRVELDDIRDVEFTAGEGVDVMLLLDQAVERVYSDGSALYYYHGVSRAVTPVGTRQASTLQQMPDAFLLKIRIIKPDGRVVVPAQMEARNGGLVLGDVAPGDLVEEEYVASVRPTGASRRGHMSPYVYRFADEDRAFGRSEYLLLVPDDVELKMDGNFEGLDREEWDHEGLHAIRWLNEDVPPLHLEPLSPMSRDLLPWVSYSFGVTWQDVGDIMRDRMLGVFRTSPELRAWSAPILAESDAEEAVRGLVEGVLEEVAPGRRAMDLSVTAGQSFSRREGNRLGVIAAALTDAGWDVDLVMGRPAPLAGAHLEVPTLETFGEPLLRAQRGFGPGLDRSRGRIGRREPHPADLPGGRWARAAALRSQSAGGLPRRAAVVPESGLSPEDFLGGFHRRRRRCPARLRHAPGGFGRGTDGGSDREHLGGSGGAALRADGEQRVSGRSRCDGLRGDFRGGHPAPAQVEAADGLRGGRRPHGVPRPGDRQTVGTVARVTAGERVSPGTPAGHHRTGRNRDPAAGGMDRGSSGPAPPVLLGIIGRGTRCGRWLAPFGDDPRGAGEDRVARGVPCVRSFLSGG